MACELSFGISELISAPLDNKITYILHLAPIGRQ